MIPLLLRLVLVALTLTSAFAETRKIEAIKFLVEDLSNQPFWTNGKFVPLPLPKDASFEQLTSAYLKRTEFKFGYIHDYNIDETKICEIPSHSKEIYKIVRISSDQGGKFLIFRYEPYGWWTRNYDAKEQYRKAEAEQGAAPNSHSPGG
jgi:hypothetical protein